MISDIEERKRNNLPADKLKVTFSSCPVEATLGVLGKKWTFLIIRNIALYGKHRFNDMLKVTPGLTPRVLSMRLKELQASGLIEVTRKDRNLTAWDLTTKGRDTHPILMYLAKFGSKWFSEKVFNDGKPRDLDEIFSEKYVREILEI